METSCVQNRSVSDTYGEFYLGRITYAKNENIDHTGAGEF